MTAPFRLGLIVGVCASCALPAGLSAQDVLPLDRAVRDALAHNAGLEAARAGVRQADARGDEASAAYWPRVSFSEAWQRGNQPVFVFGSLLSSRRFAATNFAIDALNNPSSTALFRGAIGVEQLIFDGGQRRAATDAATGGRDVASAGADEASAALALGVTQAYGRVLAARAAERAATAAVTAAQEDHARAERRRDAGTVSDADVLLLAVHLADVQQRAIQANGDATIARAELNRLMGAPIDRAFDVAEPPDVAGADAPANLDALFAEADGSRPELRRAAAAERVADAGRREARSAWLPKVAAQAGYEVNGTDFTDRAGAWLVGGELRWTLSAGGSEAARVRTAAEGAARATAERADARAAVRVEIVTALARLQAARARDAVAQSAVAQARESERIVRDRFDAGMAATADVLRAATAVLDADAQRTSAIVDTIVSAAMLRRALGRAP